VEKHPIWIKYQKNFNGKGQPSAELIREFSSFRIYSSMSDHTIMDVLERREVCYDSILKTASVIQTIRPYP